MNRLNQLTSPRSKPILEYTNQITHILSLTKNFSVKLKLLEGLREEIEYKMLCLKTPKIKMQLSNKLQQQLLWKEIQRMQISIIEKRMIKQDMENTICECWEEYSNLEDITNVKKQIKDTLDEQINKYSLKKDLSQIETISSFNDFESETVKKDNVSSISIQSQINQGVL